MTNAEIERAKEMMYVIENESGEEVTYPKSTQVEAWLEWVGYIGQSVTAFNEAIAASIEKGFSVKVKLYPAIPNGRLAKLEGASRE